MSQAARAAWLEQLFDVLFVQLSPVLKALRSLEKYYGVIAHNTAAFTGKMLVVEIHFVTLRIAKFSLALFSLTFFLYILKIFSAESVCRMKYTSCFVLICPVLIIVYTFSLH